MITSSQIASPDEIEARIETARQQISSLEGQLAEVESGLSGAYGADPGKLSRLEKSHRDLSDRLTILRRTVPGLEAQLVESRKELLRAEFRDLVAAFRQARDQFGRAEAELAPVEARYKLLVEARDRANLLHQEAGEVLRYWQQIHLSQHGFTESEIADLGRQCEV